MKNLLNDISIIPGVNGSCIFDRREGTLCRDFQNGLTEDLVESVSTHLIRLINMGHKSGLDVRNVSFRFDKYNIVGLPFDSGSVLLTVCDAQVNSSLVISTAEMLAADMKEEMDQGKEVLKNDSMLEDIEVLDFEQIVEEPELTVDLNEIYKKIETALSKSIGPVASLIMQDHLDRWKAEGPESSQRLAELINALTAEIGDEDRTLEFQNDLSDLL